MKIVGIIPAAGHGSRLQPFRYPKELFPIGYTPDFNYDGETFRLRVVCEYSLECLVAADVSQAYVVVSDHKFEVVRFFSDGKDHGIQLAYLHQRQVNGLPQAIDCAYPWARESISALVLPDTIVEPRDSVALILESLRADEADVVLGVYPTDHPEDLCAVDYDNGLRVVALYDKCARGPLLNTWGTAVWRPSFADFLHDYLKYTAVPTGREFTLAEILTAGLSAGLRIHAVPFGRGRFWDIGKNSSLVKARREFERLSSVACEEVL